MTTQKICLPIIAAASLIIAFVVSKEAFTLPPADPLEELVGKEVLLYYPNYTDKMSRNKEGGKLVSFTDEYMVLEREVGYRGEIESSIRLRSSVVSIVEKVDR